MTKIVGREPELDRILKLLDSGEPAVVLVSGEAGIGKTTLIDNALQTRHGRAGQTLWVRCHEQRSAPFSPLTDLLPDSEFHDSHAGEETPAEGIVAAVSSVITGGQAGDSSALVIEDLHWAGPDTLDLIPLLAERLCDAGLHLIGSYRSEGLPRRHRLRWVRNELRRSGRLSEIKLGPISREAARQIIGAVTQPTESLVETIHSRSRGVPFYLCELAAAAAAASDSTGAALSEATTLLPESIRDAISARFGQLSEAVQEQLYIAALLGNVIEVSDLVSLAGDPDAVLESGFVHQPDPTKVEFRHSLVRDAIRAEIPWATRRRLHRRIASFLDAEGANFMIVAEHWLAAGEKDAARAGYLRTVDASEAIGALRDASRAGHDALRLLPADRDEERVELLLRVARCEQLTGELAAAEQSLRELSDHPRVRDNPARTAEVHRRLAVVNSLQGKENQAFQARSVAASAYQTMGLSAEAAAEYLQQLSTYILNNRFEEAIAVARDAATLAEQDGRVDIQARALGLAGHVLAMTGNHQQALATVEQAFRLAVRHELSAISAETYRRLAGVMEFASNYSGAIEVYTRALEQCRIVGAEEVACDAMGCMCYVLFRSGDWNRSLPMARELVGSTASPSSSIATALFNIAVIRTMKGEFRSANKAIREAEQYARQRGFRIYLVLLRWPRAYTLEARGEDEAAYREYRGLLETAVQNYERHDLLPCLCHASACFARRRAHQELSTTVEFLAQIAAETGNPEAYASLVFCNGSSTLATGRFEEAVGHYTDAAERFGQIGLPLEQAHALHQAGLAARRAGKQDRGSDFSRNAALIARRLGARPLLARIASQEKPFEADAPAESLLSPRQLEVALRLAEGQSNKEIASRLYISPRTVEMHVAHLFDRLNCRSRTEAARRLAELGLLK